MFRERLGEPAYCTRVTTTFDISSDSISRRSSAHLSTAASRDKRKWTRKGLAGMRTALENFFDGAGRAATVEVEEVHERGERVFARMRLHARGASSGAAAVGPPVGIIYTIRDGRVFRIEWHYDVDKALAEFERGG